MVARGRRVRRHIDDSLRASSLRRIEPTATGHARSAALISVACVKRNDGHTQPVIFSKTIQGLWVKRSPSSEPTNDVLYQLRLFSTINTTLGGRLAPGTG